VASTTPSTNGDSMCFDVFYCTHCPCIHVLKLNCVLCSLCIHFPIEIVSLVPNPHVSIFLLLYSLFIEFTGLCLIDPHHVSLLFSITNTNPKHFKIETVNHCIFDLFLLSLPFIFSFLILRCWNLTKSMCPLYVGYNQPRRLFSIMECGIKILMEFGFICWRKAIVWMRFTWWWAWMLDTSLAMWLIFVAVSHWVSLC